MSVIFQKIWYNDSIIDSNEAKIHIWSAAVLYGLSIYTVFPIIRRDDGFFVFRIQEHLQRLKNSAKLIGIELPNVCNSLDSFLSIVRKLTKANSLSTTVFVRVTIHVDELVPGTRSKWLHTILSIFLYEAKSIVPQNGMKLKISPWQRNSDFCIPSRAKVNGGYINSVLAKQDAIDSGYDDAIFLDRSGHVCELSAANIFLVRNGVLITPDQSSDILEGINRLTILEIANSEWIQAQERTVDMTELYIADEVFVTGTSAYVAPVINIDGRIIGNGKIGHVTQKMREIMQAIQSGEDNRSNEYMTKL